MARVPALAWGLTCAGAIYFASTVGVLDHRVGAAALFALAGLVVVLLVFTVDPAWLLSGGVVLTMFAGHWDLLGLSSSVGPHRILIAAGMLAVLLRAPPARERPPIRLTRVHLALAGALAYALVSALAAGTLSRFHSQFNLLDSFGVVPFMLFLVAPVAFATERQRMILLGSVVAAGAYLSLTAVFEKVGLTALVVPSYIADPGIGLHFGRARGPFAEAGADGLALYACAAAAGVAFARWRDPRYRAAAAAVGALCLVGTLLTVTRSVWIASIAATVVALVTTGGLRAFLVPSIIAGVVMVLGAFALIPGLAREAKHREADQGPVFERQNTTAAGLRMVAAKPLVGFGWDRGNDDILPYFKLDPNIPLTGEVAGFHNVYLRYAVTLGLLGLGAWLLAVGLAFTSAFSGRSPRELAPWRVGLKAVLAAWLIVGLSSPAEYIFSTVLLWTWAGVACGPAPPNVEVPAPALRMANGS